MMSALVALAGSGCAHAPPAGDAELVHLRERVTQLQQRSEADRRRVDALEAQLAAMARRLETQRPAPAPAPQAPAPAPERVRPAPPPPAPTSAIEDEDEDSFAFIVDRGGDELPGTSRPSRQARRGRGVDLAPPLPTEVPLREPASGPDAYDLGVAALGRGDLDQAEELLASFLTSQPRDSRADNAGLELGEVLLRRGLPGRALSTWEQVVRDYPAGDALPRALLRYGETCRQLGRQAAARAAFQRLVQNHPGTEAASRAQAHLDEGI